MANEKMALEAAENDFKRFIDAWEIDANIDRMLIEDRESFEQQKGRIVNQIMAGYAVIDDAGDIIYTLKFPEGAVTELKFTVPKGEAYMRMDAFKERQGVRKMNAFMGAMTKQPPALFANMDARDVKIGTCLLPWR